MKLAHWYYLFLYLFLDISKGPPVQFPGARARPPTSFGAPFGAPSAPGAPSYPPVGFSNAPPTSFGMPQPYSQAPAPYPIQPMHPFPGSAPMQTNTYPSPQMPYPSQSTCYPSSAHSNQSVPSFYPQQQNYNAYPNLQTAPDAKEYFSNTPSSYPSRPNTYTTNSIPYQSGSYPGGQGVSSKYPYVANPPTATHGTIPAPRRDRFTPKVRLRIA